MPYSEGIVIAAPNCCVVIVYDDLWEFLRRGHVSRTFKTWVPQDFLDSVVEHFRVQNLSLARLQ